jgi:NAD(P)-dependent dehydrogenase (short-subunit alcohol dehydrogenase family)
VETALITGANRGIGLALTRRFIRGGYRVVATCRNPGAAQALRDLNSSNVVIYQLDVTDGQSVSELCRSLREQTIDILINNAGVLGGDRQNLADMDYDAWLDAFEVNTLAPFRMITALRPNLTRATRPRAITLSSQMGALSRRSTGSFGYRSSKAAVNKVMQVLALELRNEGIIVCPVHPGWVRTDMGGEGAEISVEESADGVFNLVQDLSMSHSGRFWTWRGEEHPW